MPPPNTSKSSDEQTDNDEIDIHGDGDLNRTITPDDFRDELQHDIQHDEDQQRRIFGLPDSPGSTSSSKKRKGTSSGMSTPTSETTSFLREFMSSRPKLSDFLPQPKPADDTQQFFDSMAATVRKLSPLAIARIKLKVGQIVGEEEISWAEQQARTQIIYLDPNDASSSRGENMDEL